MNVALLSAEPNKYHTYITCTLLLLGIRFSEHDNCLLLLDIRFTDWIMELLF
jgi:hypothetical protein